LQSISSDRAKNDSLSVSLVVDEYRMPLDIPAEVLTDQLIGYACNLPLTVVSAIASAFRSDQPSCNDMDVKLKHITTVAINSHSFNVYHIAITLENDKKQQWEMRCLVGSTKDRLIVLWFFRNGVWNVQIEQEWSKVIRQFQLKARLGSR